MDIEQPDQLFAYLRELGRITADSQPTMRVLEGGVSNKTVWLDLPDGRAWVIKQCLPKLRVAVDWFTKPERIHHEALALTILPRMTPAGTIPLIIFEDEPNYILAMEAVPQPHENWKKLLLTGRVDLRHVDQFGRLLGTIHRLSGQHLDDIRRDAPEFFNREFYETLRLEAYYLYTGKQVPEVAAFIQRVVEDTRAVQRTLVHGDFSPKNILVYQDRLILLDHEVIHVGEPAFDVGFSLTHLLSKAHHLPEHRATFAEAARLYWRTYVETLGPVDWLEGYEDRCVEHTLACLLARVAGRSPLEYMNAAERAHQRAIVVDLIGNRPASMPGLIDAYIGML
ncbi:MAG: phosphotransferase [Chloroflexi bacterium]|uniref:phosphotransferase family protein n=1 Tax=Candidatus Flexifilum breve TaxID=3140694 RepID=UPI003136BF2A|nr:phosphotransferase [Chloroflexota bacterium]